MANNKKKAEDDFRRRLQRQMYLAKESPELVYDLSSCNLSEIPAGVTSLCKVLQKEALILSSNHLKHLKPGDLKDLFLLKMLDLHSNQLKTLPHEICYLKNLTVLNVEDNRLSTLPFSMEELKCLQTLIIKKNQYTSLPTCVCKLQSLVTLDISLNKITTLLKDMCNLKYLKDLTVDVDFMVYPNTSVCSKGTAAIMKFLCKESSQPYMPADTTMNKLTTTISSLSLSSVPHVMTVSLPTSPTSASSNVANSMFNAFSHSDSALNMTLQEYENMKERKRQERIALEKQMDEDYRQQALLAAQAAANKKQLLQFINDENSKFNSNITSAHMKKYMERDKLIESLQNVEENTRNLVSKFIETNEKARKTEELLDRMEKEKLEKEQWYIVRQEELNNLRKTDIAESFEKVLDHSDIMGLMIKRYMEERRATAEKSINEWNEMSDQMEETLKFKQAQKQLFLEKLLNEEKMQRDAYEMLQVERDVCHNRLLSQIHLVELQLSELTLLELEKRSLKVDEQLNILENNRAQLMLLLKQLFEEREKREAELRMRLEEMERRNQTIQADYWLVQYQRLLDSKPQFDQEVELDLEVVDLLKVTDTTEYIPIFARRLVTMEMMMNPLFDDKALRELGVSKDSARMKILDKIIAMRGPGTKDASNAQPPTLPTAPKLPPPPLDTPTAAPGSRPLPSLHVTELRSECVVCMEQVSNVLFLNCGHICACSKCSQQLTHCPMDRKKIEQKIQIFQAN